MSTSQTISCNCPKCNSDNTTRYPVIYTSGITGSNTSALSYTQNIGATLTKGKTVSQTELSRKASPPSKPTEPSQNGYLLLGLALAIIGISIICGGLLTGNTLVFLLSVPFSFAIVGLAIYFLIKEHKKTKEKYQERLKKWETVMQEWERTWYCGRCGYTFTL